MTSPGAARKVNVAEIIDHSRIGPFQILLFTLCGVSLVMDGFDVQAIGYVAPAIISEWNVPASSLGPVFGAGNTGVLFGSLLFTMLADKIGRRPVLVGATFFFALLTYVTALADTVRELLVIRFIAGFGLGCIIPNATALIAEYSPRRLRAVLMATISVGFTAGAALGGFFSAWMIPQFGWRSVFYVGAAVPAVGALLMLFWLPDSIQILILRRKKLDKVGAWLTRIAPDAPIGPDTEYVVPEENRGGVPAMHLFREGRGPATILLWVLNFMNIYNVYFLANWLPTFVRDYGYSTSTASLVGATLQVGGTLGTFWLTWFIFRKGFVPILTATFVVATLTVALAGQSTLPLWVIYAIVFVAGSCIIGGQPTINALSGSYYPTYLRSTGIGWGLGIGRVGAIVGPVLAGELLALEWSSEAIFLVAAVPAFISAVVMFSLRWAMKPVPTGR